MAHTVHEMAVRVLVYRARGTYEAKACFGPRRWYNAPAKSCVTTQATSASRAVGRALFKLGERTWQQRRTATRRSRG